MFLKQDFKVHLMNIFVSPALAWKILRDYFFFSSSGRHLVITFIVQRLTFCHTFYARFQISVFLFERFE